MDKNYTSAPWVIFGKSITSLTHFNESGVNGEVCIIPEIIASIEAEANAKLIAAAPELLEALKSYVSSLLHDYEVEKWYNTYKDDSSANKVLVNAIAAIKKATV